MYRYRWEIALAAQCAIWGWTFVVVRDAVELTTPFAFLALRFGLAIALLGGFGALRGAERADWTGGTLMGVALFGGYAFQTVGLQYTSASNAGFITGLFVVITPVLGAIAFRLRPAPATLVAVVTATVGLLLLASPTGTGLGRGDLTVLLGSVSFSFHILFTGRYAPGRSALRLTAIQMLVTCALSSAWWMAAEPVTLPSAASVWWAVVITGVLASALGFVIQTRAQQVAPPTRTAVILTAEPAFAGLFGFWLAGDRLGARGYAGAAIILATIVATEIRSAMRPPA